MRPAKRAVHRTGAAAALCGRGGGADWTAALGKSRVRGGTQGRHESSEPARGLDALERIVPEALSGRRPNAPGESVPIVRVDAARC
jgi:hypothetical protein